MAQIIDKGGDTQGKPPNPNLPVFKKTAMASINAHTQFIFKVNPYNISWGYNLRTHVDDTYGGKVVQILGTDLTSLNIDTVGGSGGIKYIQDFEKFWRDMCFWQQNTQELATFSFPSKNYRLLVWAQSLTFTHSLTNVDYPVSMVFQIQDDIAGTLKQTAMTDTLKKMAKGIGYSENDFNRPSPADEASYQAQLAADDAANAAAANGTLSGGLSTTPGNVTVNGTDSSITAEQQANAQVIITVALNLFSGTDGKLAAIIGVMTALDESSMKNITYGDQDSLGMFQQRSPWGPPSDREDPTKSTTMFFTGGEGGQPGLNSVSNWQALAPWVAAQKVQQSGTPDGSNYHAQYAEAVDIVTKIIDSNSTSSAITSGTGVSVTIPNKPDVAAEIRGATIMAPTPGVANGLIQGLSYIGTPYVYGGGDGLGSGPDHGSRAGNNNPLVGFDCSGLAAYVVKQEGFQVAGSTSGPQAAGGKQIPYAQVLPGDLIGYQGHIAVALGAINGTQYLLEAPYTGVNVSVRAVYPSNEGVPRDPNVARYWM